MTNFRRNEYPRFFMIYLSRYYLFSFLLSFFMLFSLFSHNQLFSIYKTNKHWVPMLLFYFFFLSMEIFFNIPYVRRAVEWRKQKQNFLFKKNLIFNYYSYIWHNRLIDWLIDLVSYLSTTSNDPKRHKTIKSFKQVKTIL